MNQELKNFKCKKCGNCCKATGFVHISKSETKKIADYLNMDYYEFKKKFTEWILFGGRVLKVKDDASCIFLEKNLCKIYEVRPTQCKTFPFWESVVNDDSEVNYIKSYCKGL